MQRNAWKTSFVLCVCFFLFLLTIVVDHSIIRNSRRTIPIQVIIFNRFDSVIPSSKFSQFCRLEFSQIRSFTLFTVCKNIPLKFLFACKWKQIYIRSGVIACGFLWARNKNMEFSFTLQTTSSLFSTTQKYTFGYSVCVFASDRMNEFDRVRNMKLQYGRLSVRNLYVVLFFFFFFLFFTQRGILTLRRAHVRTHSLTSPHIVCESDR